MDKRWDDGNIIFDGGNGNKERDDGREDRKMEKKNVEGNWGRGRSNFEWNNFRGYKKWK